LPGMHEERGVKSEGRVVLRGMHEERKAKSVWYCEGCAKSGRQCLVV
jgi:hypothetical protein